MIAFKEPSMIHHYRHLPPILVEIVEWVDRVIYRAELNEPFMVITSIWRNDGIHSLYRAVDVSVRKKGEGDFYPIATLRRIEAEINNRYDYGKVGKQVALVHVGPAEMGAAWHLHLQTRPETRRREPISKPV